MDTQAVTPTETTNGRPAARQGRRELYDRAIELMQERLSDPDFTVVSAAHELFVSRRQLQRVFQECGDGSGFRSELAVLRVKAATALIQQNPHLRLERVAEMVGYRKPGHFSKVYREQLGLRPSQAREVARQRALLLAGIVSAEASVDILQAS